MVPNVQPITHIETITVDRQVLATQGVSNHERDQLLGKVVGSVVVRTVRRQDRQPVGMVIGANQMVRGGL
ncbi:hypothetical protein D3C72_2131240 [compost metagenome]